MDDFFFHFQNCLLVLLCVSGGGWKEFAMEVSYTKTVQPVSLQRVFTN